jgi:hypothetical protein
VSFDAAVLAGGRLDEELGEWLEAGGVALTGLVPSVGAGDDALSDPAGTVAPVRALRRRLGLDADVLRAGVVVTPACGLAGATPAYARAALAHCRDAARVLADDPEG